jgi:pimeloyl-ACP methyl ester carboxylesterase
MFDGQWDVMARRFRVIRYDMRGFGQSSEAHGPLCRRDDLAQLLAHLGVSRAHFVGCSNGGEIVLDLALEQPDLAASLTLVDATPSGFELQGEPPRYMLEMFDALGRGDVDRATELQVRVLFDGMYREPAQMDAALRERALAMSRIPVERKTSLIADAQPARPLDPPAVTRLGEVRCPTLVVVGALDHPELLRAADLMSKGIPNARKVIIDDSGHVPSFERPDVFNRALLEFLDGR